MAIVANIIAYFAAAYPRTVRQELERIGLSQEYPDLTLLRRKCRALAMLSQSHDRDRNSAKYVFEDVAVFSFIAMSYSAVGAYDMARTYFDHVWVVTEQLRLNEVAQEDSIDVYHKMVRRLLWVASRWRQKKSPQSSAQIDEEVRQEDKVRIQRNHERGDGYLRLLIQGGEPKLLKEMYEELGFDVCEMEFADPDDERFLPETLTRKLGTSKPPHLVTSELC